jgi:hypothetical protein
MQNTKLIRFDKLNNGDSFVFGLTAWVKLNKHEALNCHSMKPTPFSFWENVEVDAEDPKQLNLEF